MSDLEYASRARSYYRDFLPGRYQQIPNPEHFFSDLGQRIEDQVQTAERQLAGPDSPDEGFLAKVDQLPVGGVEVEVAVQLSPRGITGVPAVAAAAVL